MIRVYKSFSDFNLMINHISKDFADGYDTGEPTNPIDLGVIAYPDLVPSMVGSVGGPAPFPLWFRNMYFSPRWTYQNVTLQVVDVVAVDATKKYKDTSGEEVGWIKFALDSKVNYPRSQNDAINPTGLPTFGVEGASIQITNTSHVNSVRLDPDDYFVFWIDARVVTEDPQAGMKFFKLVFDADRIPYSYI